MSSIHARPMPICSAPHCRRCTVRLAMYRDCGSRVEDDLTTHGEEVKSAAAQSDPRRHGPGADVWPTVVSTVLTNALIVDHWEVR
ncbi:hypothetical protein LNQ52_13210 [Klebsiella pneumoniae subsp. pneumoniae]|nr:hypothetical protein [Klebsiella pneumoniae subsp. pneumoniae]